MTTTRRRSVRCWSSSTLVFVTWMLSAASAASQTALQLTHLAGSIGGAGFSDGLGSAARFNYLRGVAVDGAGTVYIADTTNNTIRKITAAGVVTTLAGRAGSTGSADGTGSAARFSGPRGVAVDGAGAVYVADTLNHTIRRIAADGTVTTLAGQPGTPGSTDGTGSGARFRGPRGLTADASGTVYVADTANNTIRKVTAAGVVTTVAGLAGSTGSADAVGTDARFDAPHGVAVDGAGTLYVVDTYNCTIRRITAASEVTTLAGQAGKYGWTNGTGSEARFYYPEGVATDTAGTVYVADTINHTIRRVTPAGEVTTFAGAGWPPGSADGPGSAARFNWPAGVAVDGAGTLYVADTWNYATQSVPISFTVRKITPAGVVTTLAGLPAESGSADGTGSSARFNLPEGVAVDGAGTVYVADTSNHTIRTITAGGVVTTLAGQAGSSGSADGTGSAARFDRPRGVAVDATGMVYVVAGSGTLRKITPAGEVTTLAGLAGSGVAVDSAGTVYLTYNHTIRKVTAAGAVTTLAGQAGSSGSVDGVGSAARFSSPTGVAVDAGGTVYVADTNNSTVRKITIDGVVTTLAGQAGSAGRADGTGSAARFSYPSGVAVNAAGTVYVADTQNSAVREIAANGAVTTLAWPAAFPSGVAVDGRGTVYVVDAHNHAIWMAVPTPGQTPVPTVTAVVPNVGPTGGGTAVTVAGTGFVTDQTTVMVGGSPATNVLVTSATALTATTPAGTAGPVDVAVTTFGGSASLAAGFTYLAAPTVTAVVPNVGPTGGGTLATVTGTGFVAGQTTVTVGGSPATSVLVTSATTLTATTPAGTAGPTDVVVTTPGGSANLTAGFTYLAAPTVTAVVPNVAPVAGGTSVTVTGTGFVAGQTTVTVGGSPATSVLVTSATTLTAATPAGTAGPAEIVVTTPGGSATLTGGLTYVTVFTRYLAEGATSTFFDTRLALLNPGSAATLANITYLRSGAPPVAVQVPVAARTRVTVNPKDTFGTATAEFSTRVESDQPLVVDRTMSWNPTAPYGAHAETAVAAPALRWYLAEGATHSGFDLFYLLQNPNGVEAQVRVRYLRPSGTPLEKVYALPPTSRTNIWVDVEDFSGQAALASTDVSAVFEVLNAQPIIVERAMYAEVPGQIFGAGHESAGVTEPALEWFLAEGATGGYFDLFVLIANPGPTDAQVDATYLRPDGTTLVKPYTIAATSRFNIWVDYEDARLADTAVSTTIRSTNGVPIIVERAMWWPDGAWHEAHNTAGATTTGTRWALAEGEVDATRNLETYLLVANTSATPADVRVTLLFEDGTSVEQTYPALPAQSRFNVPVGGVFPQAAGQRFGALVESLGPTPAQIVVERAMYWDALGQPWAAGTNALGTKLQ